MRQNDTFQDVCFHGGAFFDAVGVEFENLQRGAEIINADVLDAWFPPSPRVVHQLQEYLPWIARTSPPTNCEGLVATIARCRALPPESILAGAGSSTLMFLALREWLNASSRVLLLDPTYGEYAHICDRIIGCQVDRFPLNPDEDFQVDLDKLADQLSMGYDLLVLVNPNNPTGRHIARKELENFLDCAPQSTMVWIDEAYIDYVSPAESLESYAASSANVIVCKSMSKAYALSGLRVGYLCGHPQVIGPLLRLNPPWAVSLPGQVAAVAALQDVEYYQERYHETMLLRRELAGDLTSLPVSRIVPGAANFLLFYLPEESCSKTELLERCKQQGLFLRDPSATTPWLGPKALRIAVKNKATNQRMTQVLHDSVW